MIRRERIAVNHSGMKPTDARPANDVRAPLELAAPMLEALSREGSRLSAITRRRILYWLAVMAAVLVVGTIIGLIWADTSNVAGSIAVVTNIICAIGIVFLLIALAVETRRQRKRRG